MKKICVIAATAVVLSALLMGCGGKKEAAGAAAAVSSETTAAEAKELKELDVVLDWYPNAIHSFLYEAIDNGYFEEEGLKVNLISPAESIDSITFVASGKSAIGLTYPIDIVSARANEGMPVVAIGAVAQDYLGTMCSLAETDITADMATLKGKKVGYSGTGAAKAQIDTITKNAGLSEGDFELINVGFDLTTSLTTKSVDLVVGPFINDEVVTMRNNGYDVNVWRYQDYGVPAMYGLVMAANEDNVSAEPEVYEGFLRACKKGFEDMRADEEQVLAMIMSEMNSDDNPLDEVQQKESYEILLPLMEHANDPFLSMKKEVWQGAIDWMADSQLIKEAIDGADVLYTFEK